MMLNNGEEEEMTLQDQLVEAGFVSEEVKAGFEAEARSRKVLDSVLVTLSASQLVDRQALAALLPPELAHYHKALKDLHLYVVEVGRHSIRFAERPRRSYIAFCYAARRRFDRALAREARQQCAR
jgi:hypothetical protein